MDEAREPGGREPTEVCVLMSLYNGERYLRDQIETIARQQGVRVHLEARDDGCGDGRGDLCEALCREFGLSHKVERASNVGAAASFIALLHRDLDRFDYVALSDQDDFWKPDKLQRAILALTPLARGPAVYCSDSQVTDSQLNPRPGQAPAIPRLGFGNALIQNVVQGATAIINRPGIRLLQSAGRPDIIVMHDWWVYLVVSAFGTVIYDPYRSLLYRQHDSNVLGAQMGGWGFWRIRILRHFRHSHDRLSSQAAEFQSLYGDRLPEQPRKLLSDFLNSKGSRLRRMRLALDRRLWRTRGLDDVVFRGLMLLGRY